jgi:sporulation protein YlmC with PRC-barrel domain
MSDDVQVERVEEWVGQEVVDPDGEKIGKLDDVFYDLQNDSPTLGAVKAGLIGRKVHVVPLAGASLGRDHVRVAFSAKAVKDAPAIGDDGEISGSDEQSLFAHYDMQAPGAPGSSGARYESARARASRLEAADAAATRAREYDSHAEDRESEADELERKAREAEQAARDARADAGDARGDAESARGEADKLGW